MYLSWILLLGLSWFSGMLFPEAEGTEIVLVNNKDPDLSPVPALTITRDFPVCSSSLSLCVLECSTNNIQGATLSWYNDTRLCSQIYTDDFNPPLSLKLYVEYWDKNLYSCVLNTSKTSQTSTVNISQYCEHCSGVSYVEAVPKSKPVKERNSKAHLPDLSTPKVTRQYKSCSPGISSLSKCSLQCSVANSPNATLTIYNGSSVVSINTVADLNIDLSLCLEVKYQDNSIYRCVVNNHVGSKTAVFNITELCQQCPDKSQTLVSVTEGESMTLQTNVTEIQRDHQILWMFECSPDQKTLIAEIVNDNITISDCADRRFKNRLQLNSHTGDLTITNVKRIDSGVYKLQINNLISECWSYSVTVYDPLPSPVITGISSRCSSFPSRHCCSLVCSVFNVSHVTLSWLKGNSVLSSIGVFDLSSSLSLRLEVDFQEKYMYSCVSNNPIEYQTTHLDITALCPDQRKEKKLTIGLFLAVSFISFIIGAVVGRCICRHRKEDARNQNKTHQSSSAEPNLCEQDHKELLPNSSSLNAPQESICL